MKVFYLNDGSFIVVSNNKANSFPTYKETASFLYNEGVEWDEIQIAFSELIKNDHQVINFGIGLSGKGPSFIFTDKIAS